MCDDGNLLRATGGYFAAVLAHLCHGEKSTAKTTGGKGKCSNWERSFEQHRTLSKRSSVPPTPSCHSRHDWPQEQPSSDGSHQTAEQAFPSVQWLECWRGSQQKSGKSGCQPTQIGYWAWRAAKRWQRLDNEPICQSVDQWWRGKPTVVQQRQTDDCLHSHDQKTVPKSGMSDRAEDDVLITRWKNGPQSGQIRICPEFQKQCESETKNQSKQGEETRFPGGQTREESSQNISHRNGSFHRLLVTLLHPCFDHGILQGLVFQSVPCFVLLVVGIL